jgi:putative phosphonate metabolism protein
MAAGGDRYAIYFLPESDSALGQFGSDWLGYDADTGETAQQRTLAGLSEERLAAITAEPRRYGFHATLKPPFALAAGWSLDALAVAIATFAAQRPTIIAPPLALAAIGGFWALVPSRPCSAIDDLAAGCVRSFDTFRAPPAADELARRRRAGLSENEEALLQRWGYPYVMESFRFHLTLTQRLDATEGARLASELESRVAAVCRPTLRIDAISLCHQPTPTERFRLLQRYRLASAASSTGS